MGFGPVIIPEMTENEKDSLECLMDGFLGTKIQIINFKILTTNMVDLSRASPSTCNPNKKISTHR